MTQIPLGSTSLSRIVSSVGGPTSERPLREQLADNRHQEAFVNIRAAIPEDAAGIAHVHVATWRSTYRGLLPDELLANLSEERRADWWRQQAEVARQDRRQGVLLVAVEEGGEVAGFASAGPEREPDSGFEGELYAIYLLEEHQGQGIGRRLFELVVDHFRGQGCRSMRVWVLEGNPAQGFYERLGGKQLETKVLQIGGESYNEIAYYWDSLAARLT